MQNNLGEPDRRAVVAGALVGATATVAVIVLGGDWVTMSVVASAVASVPAGAVAAYASRERMQPFREGAFAAFVGFLLGVGTWMAAVSVTSSAHPLDVLLLLFPAGYVATTLGFLLSFGLGGAAGHATLMRGF